MTDDAPEALEILVDAMSLGEQVALLSGRDYWSVAPIDRLGVGSLRVTDGPNGARGGGGLFGGVSAAAFPVAIAIGASWDPDLARELGAALAEEVKSKGAHVALAPTVNLQRSVTNGRNFECFSEDPELTAALAVGYVRGLQGAGVAATVKHFVGNESEFQRTTISSQIDERTLREVYLRPFEAAVKEAGAWAVMSSYNRLNGVYTSENNWLLRDVLRGAWEFDGVVVSDWFGMHSMGAALAAGLDLEMPGPSRFRGADLVAAVIAGVVSRDAVRAGALRMLRLMARTGALRDHRPHREIAEDRPEHRALIRRAGADAAVLLKNDSILPLAAPTGRIAVIGPNARAARIMGGGSAQLNPHYAISPWEGLVARLGAGALVYAPGCTNHRWEPLIEGGLRVDFYANTGFEGAPVHSEALESSQAFWHEGVGGDRVDPAAFSARVTGQFTARADGVHRFGLHAAGLARLFVDEQLVVDAWEGWTRGRTFFEEGCDEITGDVVLKTGQRAEIRMDFRSKPAALLPLSAFRFGVSQPLGEAAIAEAARIAAGAEAALVFVGRSGEWDTEGADLASIRLPGRQDELIHAVLAANPRSVVVLQTGGPVEMPWLAQAGAVLQAWYPGQEAGHAIADVLFGDAEPGGRLPQTFPARWQDNPTGGGGSAVYPGRDGEVCYREGVFIGHRHYDRHAIAPLFAFGHGLGYAAFAMADLVVTPEEGGVRVMVKVTNVADRAGSTVVQIYVGDDEASVARPVREFKTFAKLRLQPGESRRVEWVLSPREFSFYDVKSGCWRIEAGLFTISAGFAADDLRLHGTVTLGAQTLPR